MPAPGALPRHVDRRRLSSRHRRARQQVPGGAGQLAGPGGRADLIGDHAQILPAAGPGQDRAEKIAWQSAVDPGGANDQSARAAGRYGAFALELGATVFALRRGRVVFTPAAPGLPTENIVGRVGHQGGIAGLAPGGHPGRQLRIHAPRRGRFVLGLIDRRPGGRVQHHIRSLPLEQGVDGVEVGQVTGTLAP